MNNYFYKAKFLIIIYSLVAMLLNLGSMAYIKHMNDFKAFPQLSEQYAVGSFTSGIDGDLRNTLLASFSQMKSDYLLATEFTGVDAFAVFYTDEACFPMELHEGRLFNHDDFDSNENNVIVNESAKKNCVVKEGTLYWNYGGSYFSVIGVYDDVDEYGGKTPACFINYCASELDSSIFGNFIFDSNGNIEKSLETVKLNVEQQADANFLDYAIVNSDEAKEFYVSGSNFKPMFGMLLLTAVMVLFNSIAALQNWLAVRRKEIAVRKLVGASNQSIFLWIGRGLFYLVMMSFLFGAIASWIFLRIGLLLPTKDSVQLMFGVHMQWTSLIYGFISAIVLCGFVAAVTVWRFHKKQIARSLS